MDSAGCIYIFMHVCLFKTDVERENRNDNPGWGDWEGIALSEAKGRGLQGRNGRGKPFGI